MISFKLFLAIYLFGGLTFIPLILYLVIKLHFLLNTVDDESTENVKNQLLNDMVDPNFKAGKFQEDIGVKVFRKGWITVTREYYHHFSELSKLGSDSDTDSVLDRSQLKKKQRFYAVLKHGNLFLYKRDDPNSDLVNAISLNQAFVSIWPRDPSNEVLDGSLFTKRTCICILKKGAVSYDDQNRKIVFDGMNTQDQDSPLSPTTPSTGSATAISPSNKYFLYFDNNMDKEDWYFDLINASKNEKTLDDINPLNPMSSAKTAHLNTHDSLLLIQNINATEGQLSTKWLNVLIGRLFLSLQQTEALNNYFNRTVYKKLSKIHKPGFLDDLAVQKIDVGHSAPLITNPVLRELSPEGATKIAFDIQYRGDMNIIIATKVNISLGSRFKQREFSVQLSIKVKEISGPMILIIKPPPSNRIWYAFESEPILNFEIEPIVSSSKLSYNVITNAIKSKLIEGIKESLVAPFMDDLVFYPTESEIFRGGIWEKNESEPPEVPSNPDTSSIPSTEKFLSNDDMDNLLTEKVTIPNFEVDSLDETHSAASSADYKGSQMSNVKKRTLQKVESLKNSIQYRKSSSNGLSDKDEFTSPASSDTRSIGSTETTEENSSSKKYIKYSIKKIGKWYKDNVASSDDNNNNYQVTDKDKDLYNDNQSQQYEVKPVELHSLQDAGSQNDLVTNANVEPKGELPQPTLKPAPVILENDSPKMISNRRRPVPKVPNVPLALAVSTSMTTSGSSSSLKSPTSPTPPSTGMFINHERTRSISSSSSTDVHNYINPDFKEAQLKGFIKHNDFTTDTFNDTVNEGKLHLAMQQREGVIKNDYNSSNLTLQEKLDAPTDEKELTN
ncbi:hypothetical protein Kpol_538p7 [Vanderwaltozyma polyspora DSM 70294]|uniref:SMP-LTD domain-containing protein n=1 Tax=Vanderwaltozyma polyspora (strain ATCC 22028 / DSM 70294 / BCRC 21397 / CBS 2163 / NBRC 10782 / NRRL Y-8283 / UCD 57-17) TaxID=436907 RepID=A7TKC0_VANPO|nr:uncharacterized protein Kpol_538p7 [Vanderwaltozyma polyspora DSM 70294]EDO17247.1 hypothetical protein Kpol_538p7 [Vanderwaltozyma polyspora DSM 70294]